MFIRPPPFRCNRKYTPDRKKHNKKMPETGYKFPGIPAGKRRSAGNNLACAGVFMLDEKRIGELGGTAMRRLYRVTKDEMIAGVCAGVGEYFEIDPTIVRLIWVAFGLMGAGILVYILAWIVVPVKPSV
jgi:phage shock protein C